MVQLQLLSWLRTSLRPCCCHSISCRHLQVDDSDLAHEDAAEAARLASLLPQLQDAAEREGGSSNRRGGAALYDAMDVSGTVAWRLWHMVLAAA